MGVCVCVCVQARLSLVMSHVAAVVPFHVDDDTGEQQTSAEHAESDADSDHHQDSCQHTHTRPLNISLRPAGLQCAGHIHVLQAAGQTEQLSAVAN